MTLRPLLTAASLLALATLPASAGTQSYKVSEATAVDVRGGIIVIFSEGATRVTAENADSDFSDLLITNAGGELKISRKSLNERGWWRGGTSMNARERDGVLVVKVNGKERPAYTVRVSLPDVTRLKAAQSSIIRAPALSAGALTLDASSSGEIEAAGTAGATIIEASSSGSVEAAGLIASGLTLDASSSGEATARTRTAAPVSITVSSSAGATVSIADAAPVTADVSTSADLTVSGGCTSATLTSSTSGDLDASALMCDSVNADASTSGGIKASAKSALYARASTSGDVSVRGAPATRDIKESTSGDVSLAP